MDLVSTIGAFLGRAFETDFIHTCAIFAVAAWVHARQVRAEIKTQFGELVSVIKDDLTALRKAQAVVDERVARLEERLKPMKIPLG